GLRYAAGQDVSSSEPVAPALLQISAIEPETSDVQPVAQAAEAEPAAEATAEPVSTGRVANGLHMRFNNSCWVQVSSADGKALHTQLMQAEQSLDIDHDGPIEVVIGAIEAVSAIEYQGSKL